MANRFDLDLISDDRYMSPEQLAAEEALYEEGCRADQYDGWDTGDLNNPNADDWENDDAISSPEELALDPLETLVAYEPPFDSDDILF
jgi:hypothetical protein